MISTRSFGKTVAVCLDVGLGKLAVIEKLLEEVLYISVELSIAVVELTMGVPPAIQTKVWFERLDAVCPTRANVIFAATVKVLDVLSKLSVDVVPLLVADRIPPLIKTPPLDIAARA